MLSINATAEEESIVLDPKIHKVENNKLNSKDYMSQEILYAGSMCLKRFKDNRLLILILILIHFIVWFKVATDCFFILGVFIALSYIRDYEDNRSEKENQVKALK